MHRQWDIGCNQVCLIHHGSPTDHNRIIIFPTGAIVSKTAVNDSRKRSVDLLGCRETDAPHCVEFTRGEPKV
jgi:hypothetical protein